MISPDKSPDRAPVIAAQFLIPESIASIHHMGIGHIHQTFRVDSISGPSIIIQRLNQAVFPDVEVLIENQLTLQPRWTDSMVPRIPMLLATQNGRHLVYDDDGHPWRAMTCLDGISVDALHSPTQAHAAARAFGMFARHMNLPDPLPLKPCLADFHNTPLRLQALQQAAITDPRQRRGGSEPELAALLSREFIAHRLQDALDAGRLPLRNVHADTKINNLLFDPDHPTRVIGIVDLDTIMPGLLAFDFGDLIRTAAVDTAEDEPDPSRVHLCPDFFQAILEGYREGCGDLLSAEESRTLADGALVITYEVALRFLTDHLLGDVYFHTAHPDHNLIRARTQIALVEALLKYASPG